MIAGDENFILLISPFTTPCAARLSSSAPSLRFSPPSALEAHASYDDSGQIPPLDDGIVIDDPFRTGGVKRDDLRC